MTIIFVVLSRSNSIFSLILFYMGTQSSPGIFLDDDVAVDQSTVDDVGSTLAILKHIFSTAELTYTFVVEKASEACDVQPDNPCVGASMALACFPNPGYYVCQFVKSAISTIASAFLQAANIALEIVEEQYLNAMKIGDSQVYYNYYYSRATYVNELGHADWNAKALEAIRINMKDQHMQMKFQLQERHKDIANHVGQDVSENCILVCYFCAHFHLGAHFSSSVLTFVFLPR